MTEATMVTLRRQSSDPILNRDVLAICHNVVQACADIISVDPPLGRKPYVVQQAPDGTPRACLNGLAAGEYLINVACLHTRLYCQLAFQLGHEIGHFYVDPRYSNWFIESVCTSISFLCLGALADKWVTAPPFPNWQAYASAFADYRQKTVADAVSKVGLPTAEAIPTWISTRLTSIVTVERFGRSEEMLCADTIASMMRAHKGSCSAITRLGGASQVDGTTDFLAWRQSVSSTEAKLVYALANTFAHGFLRPAESNKQDAGDG